MTLKHRLGLEYSAARAEKPLHRQADADALPYELRQTKMIIDVRVTRKGCKFFLVIEPGFLSKTEQPEVLVRWNAPISFVQNQQNSTWKKRRRVTLWRQDSRSL